MSFVDPSGLSQAPAGCSLGGMTCMPRAGGFGLASVVSTHRFQWVDIFFSAASAWFNPATEPWINYRGGGGVGDSAWGSHDSQDAFCFGMTLFFGTVTFQVHDEIFVLNIPNITGVDIEVIRDGSGMENECLCKGAARVLKGNIDLVGYEEGGLSGTTVGKIAVRRDTAAVDPGQREGGKPALRRHRDEIQILNERGEPLATSVSDVIGEEDIPVGYPNIRAYLKAKHPNMLLIELHDSDRDLGIIKVQVCVPAGLSCPEGTRANE